MAFSWLMGVIESARNLEPSDDPNGFKLCDLRCSKSASASIGLDSRKSTIF